MLIEIFLALSLVTDFDEARFINSQRQLYDTSCGYASVAAVMNNWYGENVNERALILETLSEKELSENGQYNTSMKTLKDILIQHGYFAKAYEMDYGTLIDAVEKYAPTIVHYKQEDGHFLIVLYADENSIVVSDSISGTSVLSKSEFKKLFSGNVLLIHGGSLNQERLESTIAECNERFSFLQNSQRFL